MARSRTSRSKGVATSKIANSLKNAALASFINELVDKKLKSKKRQHILDNEDYLRTLQKLRNVGIKWMTKVGLKFRVLRKFRRIKKAFICNYPPPPDDHPVNNSSSSDCPISSTTNDPSPPTTAGRPKGTSIIEMRKRLI